MYNDFDQGKKRAFYARHRVCLILPYFGVLPNYFSIWLKTIEANSNIYVLLITDCDLSNYRLPKNVIVQKDTFINTKKKIKKVIPLDNLCLHEPYKLCDYRPAYGLIFKEELKGYEYWGHCDPDIIWGDIESFLKEPIQNGCVRIYRRGHLTLYRNEDTFNTMFMRDSVHYDLTYKDVYTHKYSAHFDEGFLLEDIFDGYKTYKVKDHADIQWRKKEFTLAIENGCLMDNSLLPQIYVWSNGKLYMYFLKDGTVRKREYSYLHLQKRHMLYNADILNYDSFIIIPNTFIKYTDIVKDIIIKYSLPDKEYEYKMLNKRIKEIIKNIREGAMLFRWINRKGRKEN